MIEILVDPEFVEEWPPEEIALKLDEERAEFELDNLKTAPEGEI